MRRLLSAPAKRDIAAVLDWSHERFGTDARHRYERLIAGGLLAIAAPEDPPGSRAFQGIEPVIRIFHLKHVRRTAAGLPVRQPRHVLIYERPASDLVIVLRLLHDAMDLPTRLLDDDRPG